MKNNIILLLLIAAIGCGFSGELLAKKKTKGKIQIDPKLYVVKRADFEGRGAKRIELPREYDVNQFKELVVTTSFYGVGDAVGEFSFDPVPTLSASLESKLAQFKRFTVVSRTLGTQAKLSEKAYQDQGNTRQDGKLRMGRELNPGFALTAGITLAKERHDRVSEEELVYVVRVAYQFTDLESNQILESDTAEGRSKRTVFRLPSGTIVGGFSEEQEMDAINEAGLNALKVIVNKLGNKLPAGGAVAGCSDGGFLLRAGTNDGIFGEQVAVFFYRDDIGFDYPLAVAELKARSDSQAQGEWIAYTTSSSKKYGYSKSQIQKAKGLMSDPAGFCRSHSVYAVSLGMPLPPKWQANYRN